MKAVTRESEHAGSARHPPGEEPLVAHAREAGKEPIEGFDLRACKVEVMRQMAATWQLWRRVRPYDLHLPTPEHEDSKCSVSLTAV